MTKQSTNDFGRVPTMLRRVLFPMALSLLIVSGTAHAKTLIVAYAGSMGPLMDHYIGPKFARLHHARYQGIGRGAFGLAHMIQARQINPDIFISITRGPIRLLEKAGLAPRGSAFASTRMVLAWSPHSPLAQKFAAVKLGHGDWYKIIETQWCHFGRTDPITDPQGRATVLCLMLAAKFYHQPHLVALTLGPMENPAQIFTEASLMFRLRAGQLDACVTYQSAACAADIPFMPLPPPINLGDIRYEKQYTTVVMHVKSGDGRIFHFQAHPLVFYSTVLKHARHPRLAKAFVHYLRGRNVKPWLRACGYTPLSATMASALSRP